MKQLINMLSALVLMTFSAAQAADAPALDFKMKSLEGEEVDLSKYKGKVVLMVNTASRCGLTPQYKGLQAMHEKYADKGLAIIGFPCNQFGKQEPGTADDIKGFCEKNYGVTFAMMEKVDVNGDEACDLYKHLRSQDTQPKGSGKISWNFEKFLIGKDGKVIGRFSPRTKPDAKDLVEKIEAELSKS